MVFIDADPGLIIVTACGHRGIPNTIEHARSLFPNKPIALLLGGFHLESRPETVPLVLTRLQELRVQKVIPCHCTGFEGKKKLSDNFGHNFNYGATGSFIEVSHQISVCE
jgi:7,8-dihydropterin-6-yl-methyl-4-(beta-D-ribofuranosyl)aminobenzene 5'-phosphate synthase